jgi:hypothetical protein
VDSQYDDGATWEFAFVLLLCAGLYVVSVERAGLQFDRKREHIARSLS